jgi:pyruvate dehydrogenase E2 component (dihydrolipoamide acetyltransferase)
VEVDFAHVERARERAGLTHLPFIARAVVDAIESFPLVNASVGSDAVVVHHGINLGIAFELEDGLATPVVHAADGKRLLAIAAETLSLADRARSTALTPYQLLGGTFTIADVGAIGTAISMPVIHQPQVAILAIDGVRRQPVVVELEDGSDAIVIHAVGKLALSWDHRVIDGAYAAGFLARVREILETRDWDAEL